MEADKAAQVKLYKLGGASGEIMASVAQTIQVGLYVFLLSNNHQHHKVLEAALASTALQLVHSGVQQPEQFLGSISQLTPSCIVLDMAFLWPPASNTINLTENPTENPTEQRNYNSAAAYQGYNLCHWLTTHSTVPLVLLGDFTAAEARRQAFAAGAYDYLPVPLEPQEVRARLHQLSTYSLNRSQQERLRLLENTVNQANDVVVITEAEPIDEPGPRIIYANPAFEKMTGYSFEEVVGKTPRLLQGPKSDRKELDRIREALAAWQQVRVELINYRKDGSEFWVELDISPVVNEQGWYTHWIAIQRDISERKDAEIEREVLLQKSEAHRRNAESRVQELQAVRQELEHANDLKRQFLANMSHELRTPLTAVLGFNEILGREYYGTLNERQRTYVQDIASAGQHLLELINDILVLSKIEAGHSDIALTHVNLPPIIERSLVIIRERLQEAKLSLEVDMPERLWVIADPRKTKQILYNLLSNAVKFTPEQGYIRVHVYSQADTAHIEVSDSGIGIAEEDLGKLFQEFEQLDPSSSRKYQGSGLGLALVKRFAEMQGGNVWVESTLGQGSCFGFSLKRIQEHSSLAPAQSLEPSQLAHIISTAANNSYPTPPATPSATPSDDLEDNIVLPAAIIEAMRQALLEADLERVLEISQATQPYSVALAHKVRELADHYDYEAIRLLFSNNVRPNGTA